MLWLKGVVQPLLTSSTSKEARRSFVEKIFVFSIDENNPLICPRGLSSTPSALWFWGSYDSGVWDRMQMRPHTARASHPDAFPPFAATEPQNREKSSIMEWITVSLGQQRRGSTHIYSFRLHSACIPRSCPCHLPSNCAVQFMKHYRLWVVTVSGGMEPPGLRLACLLSENAHLLPGKDSLKTSMKWVLTLFNIKTLYLKVILENHFALYAVYL